MCWNKNISIVTFVIALIGSFYLYKRNYPNDRWIALFGATIALIQLAEYFMWNDLSCGKINKYASIFTLIVLAIEPLMAMIGGIYLSNTPNKNILKMVLFAYLIYILYLYTTKVFNSPVKWCGTTYCNNVSNKFFGQKTCNLDWQFLHGFTYKEHIIWILFLVIPFLTMTPFYQGIILSAFGLFTLFSAHYTNNAAMGSLWCWYSILIILIKILMK